MSKIQDIGNVDQSLLYKFMKFTSEIGDLNLNFLTYLINNMQNKKALVAITSISKYPNLNRATGVWLTEVSHFYEVLVEDGWTIDFVSLKGGMVSIEPKSLDGMFMGEKDWETYHDETFRSKLAATLKPSQVKVDDYKVIFFAGGHGTVWDFYEPSELHTLATKIYENGGIVSAVCHGPISLLNLKLSNGEHLIKDKKVTGFSNEEEKMVELDKVVPYLLEDEMVKRGANYTRGAAWGDHAVEDQRVITGQNPGSTRSVGLLVVKHKW